MLEKLRCPQCGSTEVFANGSRCICGACGHRFEAPAEKQEFESMRLFLSYGHPESAICQRIYEALKERGHEPWFDQSNIRTGDNWRTTIQEGVRSSQEVIACLSPHSTRERGVCLDELAIAVGVKGGNIHSVLLAPEQEVNTPATVGHEQWLDMSDWKEKLAAGPEVFDPWFHAKMQELFQVIESRENREFSGQIQYIHDHLNIYYDTGRQNALLQKLFVGRAWLEEELDRWLEDPDGRRMCLLHGAPGVGKSAFAVHYTHYNPRVAACLFCRSGMDTFNDPRTVIQTLAYLLACRLPEYRQSLLTSLPENKAELEQLSEQELFARLLGAPLKRAVPSDHATMVLVLDGLDECGSPEENALARTLAAYADSLPRWLRVLVVARATPAVVAYTANAEKIELASGEEKNLDDVRAYYIQRLQPVFGADPQWEASLDALTTRSQGVFLYAEMMCGLLLDKGRLSAAGDYPEGLDAVFTEWFAHFFRSIQEYKQRWRLPLGCILGAPAPLPEEELRLAMGWDENQLADFCRRINVLLRRDTNAFDSTTLVIDHAYVRQWLENELNPYGTSGLDGAAALAKAFYAKFEQDAESLLYYEAVYLPGLLRTAGMEKEQTVVAGNETWAIIVLDAGDECRSWGKLEVAEEIFALTLPVLLENAAQKKSVDADSMVATYLGRIGQIREEFGDLKGALELYEKRLSLRKSIVKNRGTAEDRDELSYSYDDIGDIYQARGQLDDALALYQKAFELREKNAIEEGTLESKDSLAVSYDHVAGVCLEQGNVDKAQSLYQKAMELREKIAQKRGQLKDKVSLSISYDNLARIYYEREQQLEEAEILLQKSLEISEQIVEARGTPNDRSNLASSYHALAAIYDKSSRWEEVLSLYQKSASLTEQVVQERGIPRDRSTLSRYYYELAGHYECKNYMEKARAFYQKSMELAEQVLQERGTPGDKQSLSACYLGIADLYKSEERIEEALEWYQKSLSLMDQVMQERGTPEDMNGYVLVAEGMADIYIDQENEDKALALCQRGISLAEQGVYKRGLPDDYKAAFLGVAAAINWYEKQNQVEKALELYQKINFYGEQFLQKCGETPENMRGLAATYGSMGRLYEDRGDIYEARDLYQKGADLLERAVQKEDAPEIESALAMNYKAQARVCEEQGNFKGALNLFRKARARLERVVQKRGTPEDQQELARNYHSMAGLHLLQGHFMVALKLYQEEFHIVQSMEKEQGHPAGKLRVLFQIFFPQEDE